MGERSRASNHFVGARFVFTSHPVLLDPRELEQAAGGDGTCVRHGLDSRQLALISTMLIEALGEAGDGEKKRRSREERISDARASGRFRSP
mmetsp:Transcript_19221/g.57933  ORF Transcript_19221/g.57933 Transcript_19221/m.57933 type:complete len:91 (+) Transcript_19221:169-441(+)